MKAEIAVVLAVISTTLGLTGCKPKETTLSGQVFIVTQGADNIKFGDVEVILVDKQQVTEFVQKQSAIIEAEIKKREQAAEVAEINFQRLKYDFENFFNNQLYATNVNYIQTKNQLDESLKIRRVSAEQKALLKKTEENLLSTMTTNTSPADWELISKKVSEISSQEDAVTWQNMTNDPIVEKLQTELENIKNDVESAQKAKVDCAQRALTSAQARTANFPTIQDYLANFAPEIFQKTITDADGKFFLKYPRDKSFTILASAERKISNRTDAYFWLVDAPTNSDDTQIFLSNNNLVYIDPDGYFKVKPKE
ncbi:MAG TPA: hypothetical protein VHG71_10730 [Verrucomicrobiae bacterium]|nr:hypothetical protein [Verrucomicrobiae bacterium]